MRGIQFSRLHNTEFIERTLCFPRIGGKRNAYGISPAIPQGKIHLEDLGVNGSKRRERVYWIYLAQDRDMWNDVSTVMNIRFL
jgi:hypothetical protein